MADPWHDRLDRCGFALLDALIDDRLCDRLCAALAAADDGGGGRRRGGMRNCLARVGAVGEVARSPAIRAVVEPIVGSGTFAVHATLFDKVEGANWQVPWHRDRVIAVRERLEVLGFGPWSIKDGVPHVAPPRAILDGMLALRLHLDAVPAGHGALRVIPGSHRDADLDDVAPPDPAAAVTCVATRGSALLLRPLLLHASGPSASPVHRRVLHLEFAAVELPGGLRWHERA